MDKDFSLNSGERQIGTSLVDIRNDHVERYIFISNFIEKIYATKNINILDMFCGNGYGAFLLAKSNNNFNVLGVDGSLDAINLAKAYYKLPNNMFRNILFPFSFDADKFDVIISIESLEHVEKDDDMLDCMINALNHNGILIISVPNQAKNNLTINPNKFHYRHYIHDEMMRKRSDVLDLMCWYGQDVYEFNEDGINTFRLLDNEMQKLKLNHDGQVNIYVFKKKKVSFITKVISYLT